MKIPNWLQPPKSEYEIFKVGKAELYFTGCYIEKYQSKWRYIRGFLNTTALGLAALSEYCVAVIFLQKGDLTNLFDVLCPSTTMMVTTFKLYVMLWKQQEMQELFKLFETTFAKEVRQKGPSFRANLPQLGFYLSVFLTVTTCATGNSFNMLPLIMNIASMIKGKEPIPELPFKSWWPWDWTHTPIYETMYIYLFYASVLTQIGIPSVDALFLDFYLHVSLMFDVIRMDLTSLVQDVVGDDRTKERFTYEENEKVSEKLKVIQEKHNFCFELSDKVRSVYQEIIFVHVLSAAFIICLSSINLILGEGLHKLIFVNYIIAATTQIFFFALAGGILEEACLNVGNAAYGLPWFKMNKTVRRQLQGIIMRSQKPSKIQVPFVNVSMPMFSNICQAAGSYITLLQSFLDKTQ